jgi:type II secretory pathway component GspD/PulD (secretin)
MSISTFRTLRAAQSRRAVRALLAAAACTAFGMATPVLAFGDDPAFGGLAVPTLHESISQARAYLADGQPQHALRALAPAMRSDALLSDAQAKNELFTLLGQARAQRDAQSVSAQKIESGQLAFADDNLIEAKRHAQAVLDTGASTTGEKNKANTLLSAIESRQQEIAPQLPSLFIGMHDDFQSGQYARAKAALDAIRMAGLPLDDGQQTAVEHYQTVLYELEQVSGVIDHRPYTASVMQAGVVKRRAGENEPLQAEEPATGQMDPIELALGGSPNTEPAPRAAAQDQPQDQPVGQMQVVRQPAPQPAAQPAAQPSTQPVAQPAAQPVVQPAAQPASPTATPSMGDMRVQQGQVSTPQAGGSLIDQALRVEAQSTIANADAAFERAQYAQAVNLYFTAQQYSQYLTPEQQQHVANRLAESRLQLGDRGGSLLDDQLGNRAAQADRARTVIENLLEQAETQLATGLTDVARTNADGARSELTRNEEVLSASEFQDFRTRIEDVQARIAQRSAELAEQTAVQQERQAVVAAQGKESERIRQKEQRIREALDRVRALQAERRYVEAQAVVNNDILFIDPLNPAGLLLRDVLRDAEIYARFNRLRNETNIRISENALDNMEAVLMPLDVLEFPSNWPELSNVRLGGLSDFETAEDRATLGRLGLNPTQINFDANRLTDVLTFVATIGEIEMDVDWRSLEEIGIDRETEVTLSMRSATPRLILDRIVERVSDIGSEADWGVQDGIVVVASRDRLRKRRVLDIYDIGDLVVEVPNYDSVPEIDLQQALQSNQGGGGQSPFEDQDEDPERIPLEDRIRLVRDIIEQNVDPTHWDVDGTIQEFGKQLIINTSPKNHRQVRGLLSKLREQRAIQINAEVRFLLVSQDFFEQIGFDFDIYFNANNSQVRTAQAGDPTIRSSDFFSFDPSGGGSRGLQRSVSGAPVGGDGTAPPIQRVNSDRGWSPIGLPGNSLGLAETLFPQEGIASSVLSAAPALGIAGQFLDDIQVDFLIQATQADRRTVTLTAPRLTFMNGQIANIVVGTQIAFISDLQPVVSDSAVGFDPELDTVVEGVSLLLEGTVSADRRYVQMNVEASVSEVIDIATEAVVAVAGGQLVSSAEARSFIGLPTTTVTRVQTTVNVPDQGTALLGGQRLVSESEVETGVPILSKIPIINRFFSNRIESRDESTLMILLKPTILIQGEQEERQFPGLGSELSSFGG